MTVFLLASDGTDGRLGISVPRRVGGAVVRNRIKRRIREIFRTRRRPIPAMAILVIARPSAARASFADLEAELLRLLESGGGSSAFPPSSPSEPSRATRP